MKRLIMLFCSALIVLSSYSSIFALDLTTITIDNADGKPTYVSVAGKTSQDCTAVVIEVLTADESTIVAMETKEVNNKSFNATVSTSLTVGNTYVIKIADFDGGPWQSKEFVVKNNPSSDTPKYSVPNTGIK